MKHRILNRLLALLLTLSLLLLAGCSIRITISKMPETEPTQATEETEQPTEPFVDEPDWDLVFPRLQNAGGRDYLPDGEIQMLRFDDIEYARPDADALCANISAVTELVSSGASAEQILDMFYGVYDEYYHFYTMSSVANVRYYAEMSNEYYKGEYDFCEQASPDIEEKLEALYKACAVSPAKTALEAQCFGEGFFDDYIDYEVYTNPEYLALAKHEKTVMENYHQALENPQIEFNGELRPFEELMAEYEDDVNSYIEILQNYYEKYNPIIGGYYIELINIHRQMAEVLGYESYGDFCYDQTYGRDYTWADGKRYVAGIRKSLVPLYQVLDAQGLLYDEELSSASESLVRSSLSEIVKKLGGTIEEAYNFMLAYDLCDMSPSGDKMETSFTIYLYELETPYILINPSGSVRDIFTYAHEFGHFTDMYHTYQSDEDLETAETFSQGMEWLALCNLGDNLSAQTMEKLRVHQLADTVSVFISQAAYADFEDRVNAIAPDELTVEALNDTFRSVSQDFGFYVPYLDFYYSQCWIDVPHFFESPYYVISYCVSADTALQIYQQELASPGAGLELYNALLERTAGDGIQAVAEAAGLESPFKEGRFDEIADFIRTQLDLD